LEPKSVNLESEPDRIILLKKIVIWTSLQPDRGTPMGTKQEPQKEKIEVSSPK
jgi:hypothetical protein